MTIFTKKINLMMIVVCCMLQIVQSSDVRNQDGRTPLMNYVIQKEKEIDDKRYELNKLWDKYFHDQRFVSSTLHVSGQTLDFHDSITIRKIYTTDADVAEYRIIEDEFSLFVHDVIENIKIKVFNGADLQVRDIYGKTVRDYSNTIKIDNILRNLGAPSSLFEDDCAMIQQRIIEGIVGTIAVSIGAIVLIHCYIACHPR